MSARTGRGRTRGRRRVAPALVALTVVATVALTPVPGGAAPAAALAPGRAIGGDPAAQAEGDPAAGPYDPGFIDVPIPTNLPAPSLDDVAASSDELDRVEGALIAAEGRRADAIARRDDLRLRIVDLGEERVAAVAALEQRRLEEVQRGVEREDAVIEHDRRADLADATAQRLEVARDDLRDLMVAAFVNASSTTSDVVAVLTEDGNVDDALLRLSYGDESVDARVSDVQDRVQDRRLAVAAEDRARRAREAAEQAERDAVAAREAAEQLIVDVDAETVATQQEEVEAGEALVEREVEVLTAGVDIAPARLRSPVVSTGIDFPLVALDAWVKAAGEAPCRVEWWMLAGISKVEGRHGTFGGGRLGARGYPSVQIIGPQLNGAGPFAAIPDTDGGLYDGDTVWDRAVGPMQFIPSTWRAWGRDGDHDGFADPFTIYDAAAGAAAYLCAGRSDLTDEGQLRAAYFSYNHSQAYVSIVLSEARRYQAALALPPYVPVVDPDRPPLVPGG